MDKSKSIWLRRKPGKHAVLPDKGSTGICLQQKHGELSVSNTHSHGNQNISGWGGCRIVQVSLRHLLFLLHTYLVFWVRFLGRARFIEGRCPGHPVGEVREAGCDGAGEGVIQQRGHSWSLASAWSHREPWRVRKKTQSWGKGAGLLCPHYQLVIGNSLRHFGGENKHILWRRMNSWIPSSQYSQELGAGRWGDLMVKVIPQQLLHLGKHGWLHRASVFTSVKRNK